MEQPCTVIVPLTPKDGHRESVLSLLDEVVPEIRAGQGCTRYDVMEEVTGRIILIEEWESREAWHAHFEWPAILRLKRELPSLVDMPVERWEMYQRPGI